MIFDHLPDLAVDAAVHRVDQSVAVASPRMLQERRREDPLAAWCKDHVHRVIHAASHHRLDPGPIRTAAEDMRSPRHKLRLAVAFVRLLGERSFAPIDPAVGAGVRAVQIVGAPRQRLAGEPFFAFVGHAVAVGVGELPDAGRGRNIERAVQPHRAFGKHHLVGEDDRLVELAVAVGVFQTHDAMRFFGELLFDFVVRARRVGDIQPPLLVKIADNRPVDQRRPGDLFNLESLRKGELVSFECEFGRAGHRGFPDTGCQDERHNQHRNRSPHSVSPGMHTTSIEF